MKSKNLLKITNLHTSTNDGKKILHGVNLEIKKGETYTLLGPNGCGKSTLAHTILGNSKYEIDSGEIVFKGKVLNGTPPEERVNLGIAIAHQNPPALKGVPLSVLLKIITKSNDANEKLNIGSKLLPRDVNSDYSGGEKKISELLQILTLKPELVILDELDSGLDIKNLVKLTEIIKKELIDKKTAILAITHSGKILNLLKPDMTCVMVGGKIICRNKNYNGILKTISKYGYEKCKKCPFLAD